MPSIPQVKVGQTIYDVKDANSRGHILDYNRYTDADSILVVGAVKNKNGANTGGANYCYRKSKLHGEQTIYVSGTEYGESWPLVVFLDDSENVVGYQFMDNGKHYFYQEISQIPNNATMVCINGCLNPDEGINIPHIFSEKLPGLIDRVKNLENYSLRRINQDCEIVIGKAFKIDGTETANNAYIYGKYILNGQKSIVVSGYGYGGNWPVCIYLDSQNHIIGSGYYVSGKVNAVMELVPDNAAYVIINGKMNADGDNAFPYLFDDEKVAAYDEILNDILTEENPIDIIPGAEYRSDSNSHSYASEYIYATYKLSGEKYIAASGYSYGGNWPLVSFLNINGEKIGSYDLFSGGGKTNNPIKVPVPDGASIAVVNGSLIQNSYPHLYKPVNEEKQDTDLANYPYGKAKNKRLATLEDAFESWSQGGKYPIVILGDSTTDSVGTSDVNRNVIGTDFVAPHTYPSVLQSLLRTAFNNNVLRIYNAGFSGKSAGWGIANIDEMLWDNNAYNDAKIAIICYGINDYAGDSKDSRYNYQRHMRELILNLFEHGVQPVLMTTQSGMENHARFGWKQMSITDKYTKQLADEYNLEILDKNYFTNLFNIYSKHSISNIVSDGCHPNDISHAYIAGWLFKEVVPYTIVAGEGETIVGFADERIKTGLEYSSVTGYVWKDVKIITPINGFKLEAQCNKNAETILMDCWIFVEGKQQKNLTSYCTTPNVQTIIVDGVSTSISSSEQEIGELELGLHHIVVKTSASESVNFLGLKIN